jgi:hypothetical protein
MFLNCDTASEAGIQTFCQLIDFMAQNMDPGFRLGDVYWVFRPDVGIPILFHHPANGKGLHHGGDSTRSRLIA